MAAMLTDDLVDEILLRFPPEDPSSLVRATLDCKIWRRLFCNPSLGRRFREFHRTPPMFGFLCNLDRGFREFTPPSATANDEFVSYFVPTSPCPVRRGRFIPKVSPCSQGAHHNSWRVLDSRHGRVLLYYRGPFDLVVWDPITDEQLELPKMPLEPCPYSTGWNAALLCAVGGNCNHVDCQRCPFLVVFVGYTFKGLFARIFSSLTGTWSEVTYTLRGYSSLRKDPGVLVGSNELYPAILKCDLISRVLSVIPVPDKIDPWKIVLTVTEDGELGFANIDDFKLYLWSKETGPNEAACRWVQSRVIELKKVLPANAPSTWAKVLGFAECVGAIIWRTGDRIFTIHLKSSKVMEVEGGDLGQDGSIFDDVVPYISFYTPLLGSGIN